MMATMLDPEQLDLARWIRPGDRVAWGQCAAEPLTLTRALMAQRHRIGGRFGVFVGATWSDTLDPACADVVDFSAYCGTGANRALAEANVLDVLPCHYSEFECALARGGTNQVDVLLLQVAPAGPDGRYSLSVAHEYLVPLVESARLVMAEVNASAPWTHGGRSLGDDDIDVLVHADRPLPELPRTEPGPTDIAIARHVASCVDDGATLQLGIGSLPEAVLAQLHDRRDLGIHSGAVGDGVADLTERGVITNARKTLDAGRSVAGVMMGSRRIHAFAHRNAALQFRATSYTHAASTLAAIDRLVAINSAIEVDLTGQVNAEVASGRYLGAVGGALDFIRGARLSRGGLSIIALPSRAGRGGRIVARLGGPVSTPRSDAALIVTEYGIADLRGASLSQRVQRMLSIAHPDDREALARAAAA
jgi:acyl-CoA hydrolase